MTCLQETKTQNISFEKCQAIWGSTEFEWIENEAMNGAGEILTMWCSEQFKCESYIKGQGFLGVCGKRGQRKYISCSLKHLFTMSVK